MGITTAEAREQILEDLVAAIQSLGVASASLGEAYEAVSVTSADRLEAELFMPVQKALGRGKRAYARFAEQTGHAPQSFEIPSPGNANQAAKPLVEQAVAAAAEADHRVAELQDSMLPIEFGDAELRAALVDVRELLDGLATAAREYLRTLGR
ncbi:MAG TPA: hypothetical protein VKA36_05495 [Solirubrobacterales bacterium]|nr:hypothetical protein [Solirubrobacterales bacterium]